MATITISPIKPEQVPAAKRVICSVVCEIFSPPASPENIQLLQEQYDARGEFSDIDNFQAHYVDNTGIFLVLLDGDQVAGTGALRRLDAETAELKRMWFMPPYRGKGLGRNMADQLLSFARNNGYNRVRLDTDEKQTAAMRLYERLGFQPINRYNDSICNRFMELNL